jgi:oligoribonuclease
MSQDAPNQSASPAVTPPTRPNEFNLVWIDMEMTGLSPETDRVIELAAIVTDSDLNILITSPSIVVHQPQSVMDGMDAWNRGTHGKSGLTQKVLESTVDEQQATAQMLAFLKPWVPVGKSPMCGNSICQDRRFMAKHMPKLEEFFHYRNLDVSTLKELCKRWQPQVAKGFLKRSAHTAIADIQESIDELKYYREHFIKAPAPV